MFYGTKRNLAEKCEKGFVYEVTQKWTGVSNDSSRYIRFQTPSEGLSYIEGIVINGDASELDIEVIENPTISGGSTTLTAYNLNRQSPRNIQGTLQAKSSGVSGGTTLNFYTIYGSGGFFTSDALAVNLNSVKRIFKNDEDYVLKLTNRSGNSINLSVGFVIVQE